MKIGFKKLNRKNERQNENQAEMPVQREMLLQKRGESIAEQYGKAKQRCNNTKKYIFIRQMKPILEQKIKQQMRRRSYHGNGKNILL